MNEQLSLRTSNELAPKVAAVEPEKARPDLPRSPEKRLIHDGKKPDLRLRKRFQMIGRRFGRLVVLSENGLRGRKQRYVCMCDCGKQTLGIGTYLRSGRKKSCGCLIAEAAHSFWIRHGMTNSPEYHSWNCMIQRGTNPNHMNYDYYKGRVCERWLIFQNFLDDMGLKPSPEMELDRYPNKDGNYEPGNVRWATRTEQNRNRRNNRLVTIGGVTKCCVEWAEDFGIHPRTFYYRVSKGWPESRLIKKARPTGRDSK